jgi:pilus assembly protein CpaC
MSFTLAALALAIGLGGWTPAAPAPAPSPAPLLAPLPAAAKPGLANQAPMVSDEKIHQIEVHVGTSSIVTAPWPVARVSVTQPAVADVQVLTPTQVLLTGNTMGTTDLILWSEKEEIWHARVVVNIDLSYIKDELAKLFPTSTLDAVQSRDMVVIKGQLRRTDDVTRLRSVMDSYGVKYVDTSSVAGVQQVMLNVRVAEASRNAIRALSVNFITDSTDFLGFSRPRPDNGSPLLNIRPNGAVAFPQSVTLGAAFRSADFTALVQALAENQYIRVLAEPTLVALSGEDATFLAGGEYPIPVVQGGAGTGGNASITIEYKEFGVRLKFSPIVLGDNSIRLLVAPEVSELSDQGAVEIQGFRIPSLRIRRSETTLELHSGQSFMMAGLLNHNINSRSSRIPLLGDLPVIGTLFRSIRYQNEETELVVLVTASLVEPADNVRPGLVPGDQHVEPTDWELYIDGRLEGKVKPLAPVDAEWIRERGLNRLQGPGAWTTHDQPKAVSDAPMGYESSGSAENEQEGSSAP